MNGADTLVESPAELSSNSSAPENYDWNLAFGVLGTLLTNNDGCVSSTALRRELENKGVTDARALVVELKFYNPESGRERGIPSPNFRFRHLGRSFYSEEKYDQELRKQNDATIREADDASRQVPVASVEESPISRTNRQDEARLVTYVKSALEDLYSTDATPEGCPFVFDVHSARKGTSFENVDAIAVHWRSERVCELVTVEVKLEFSPQAVQQALSYARFSHRAWIAVQAETDSNSYLRELDPNLFEYAIARGLGILACRRRQGRSYEVFPVHWPLRNQPDSLEKDEFLERYREQFEKAGVIEREKKPLPRLV
jgi:hypothetical protein